MPSAPETAEMLVLSCVSPPQHYHRHCLRHLLSALCDICPLFLCLRSQKSLFHPSSPTYDSVRVWRETRKRKNRRIADKQRLPAASCRPGQEVWLNSKDIPLKVDSRKVAQRFIGPYTIESIVNPTTVKIAKQYQHMLRDQDVFRKFVDLLFYLHIWNVIFFLVISLGWLFENFLSGNPQKIRWNNIKEDNLHFRKQLCWLSGC